MSGNVLDFSSFQRRQTEGGDMEQDTPSASYSCVPDAFIVALCQAGLTSREMRVVLIVALKTLGFKKQFDWISSAQMEAFSGVDRTNVGKVRAALIARKILAADGRQTGVNLAMDEWVVPSKSKPKPLADDTSRNQKTSHKNRCFSYGKYLNNIIIAFLINKSTLEM